MKSIFSKKKKNCFGFFKVKNTNLNQNLMKNYFFFDGIISGILKFSSFKSL